MLLLTFARALAFQVRREPRLVCAFQADGAAQIGAAPEAMNVAGLCRLPGLLVLECNGFGLTVPTAAQVARAEVTVRIAGSGPAVGVDALLVLRDGHERRPRTSLLAYGRHRRRWQKGSRVRFAAPCCLLPPVLLDEFEPNARRPTMSTDPTRWPSRSWPTFRAYPRWSWRRPGRIRSSTRAASSPSGSRPRGCGTSS